MKVLKIISLGFLLMLLLSSNDTKNNFTLIGFYEYKSDEANNNHYIVIDSIRGKLIGKYYGSENEGEHGVAYFENDIENLKVENEKISFEISKRELYSKSQFKFVKSKSRKEKPIGFSKSKLKYSGNISNETLELNCESKYADCWETKMKFIKLKKKNIR